MNTDNEQGQTPRVFILATCRNDALIRASTLVFDTIRVGFPTAEIVVWDNDNSELNRSQIREGVKKCKGKLVHLPQRISHHDWIATLTMDERNKEPFWICDTDLVFWASMEQWKFGLMPLAGRYIPDFRCGYVKRWTHWRLHPSLLRIDPALVLAGLNAYEDANPETPFTPKPNPFAPLFLPGQFYDTVAILSEICSGQQFQDGHLNCYDHLFAGTISDLVGPCLNDGKMQERHAELMANPEKMRGLWRKQDEFFRANRLPLGFEETT